MRTYTVRGPSKVFMQRVARMQPRWQLIVSVSSVVIATAAVFVALWQVHATMEHDRLMVKPNLSFWRVFENKEPYFRLDIRNYGLGPAFITDLEAHIGAKAYSLLDIDAWDPVVRALGLSDCEYAVIEGPGESIVPAGGSLTVFKLTSVAGDWRSKVDSLGLILKYKSAYEESFTVAMPPRSFLKSKRANK